MHLDIDYVLMHNKKYISRKGKMTYKLECMECYKHFVPFDTNRPQNVRKGVRYLASLLIKVMSFVTPLICLSPQ